MSSLLVWLASSEAAQVTGKVFEAEGGKISIADGWRSTKPADKGAKWEPEELKAVVEKLIADNPPAQKVYGT